MKIQYLARGADNTLICVATETHLYASRVFVGTGSPLREVAVTGQIDRYRDGGTTDIPTADGLFHVPSPLRGHTHPFEPDGVSFAGEPFTLMDAGSTSSEVTPAGLILR